ncbi:hypothetical protein GCM10009771_04510 [Nesterenkonia flava]
MARLLLDRYLPAGLLVANTLGSLLLGWLYGALSLQLNGTGPGLLSEPATAVLALGLIGALSTFATVSLRAAQLWIEGSRLHAVGLWLVHAVCGLAAGACGIWLAWL